MPRDPMMEIFMAECQDLISQYETYLSMADEKQEYDLNLINEIFRITHTLKADATMMLYECVAVPMRAFEKVLYYCRDEIKGVLDFDELFVDWFMLCNVLIYLNALHIRKEMI